MTEKEWNEKIYRTLYDNITNASKRIDMAEKELNEARAIFLNAQIVAEEMRKKHLEEKEKA